MTSSVLHSTVMALLRDCVRQSVQSPISRYERVPSLTGRFVLCYGGLRLQLDTVCYVTAGFAFNSALCVSLLKSKLPIPTSLNFIPVH